MNSIGLRWLTVCLTCVLAAGIGLAAEGMWPMSEIQTLELGARGLRIEPAEIYYPGQISLVDGICKIDGCTGSFVSPEGLILTNHHCVYGAVQAASTKQRNYLVDGFLAASRAEEIPARNFTIRITESYRDVSAEVLAAVKPGLEPAERTNAIERRTKELMLQTEKELPGKRAEVAEMFPGKTYVLFVYTYLKDVRLVYVPPLSVGNFGGDADNWVWPRHTVDFSFLRAYVGPDGAPAAYSEQNVPYHPRKHLKVAPDGANEGDFIFIFGYPGTTYRHRTSHYLDYELRIRMPWVANWYEWQIRLMEGQGAADAAVQLRLASRINGLANTSKNYRGKLKGMTELGLVATRREDERGLQAFILADPERQSKYENLLAKIGEAYAEQERTSPADLVLTYLKQSPTNLRLAYTACEAARQRAKPDLERESDYMDRNWAKTVEGLQLAASRFHLPADRAILRELLRRALALPPGQRLAALDRLLGQGSREKNVDRFLDRAFRSSRLHEEKALAAALSMDTEALRRLKDPFVELAEALTPAWDDLRQREKSRKGFLDELFARLLDVKKEQQGGGFIPDANGTLRLTWGNLRGYSPADAVWYKPVTTLSGMMQKETGREPYEVDPALKRLYLAKDFGRFAPEALGDVPVAILYDADTTGGNSGSPVFNARGEIVGVNFDRAWEATINDFAWNERYSRSIAVDIRCVLWVTSRLGGARHLLEEMGVPE